MTLVYAKIINMCGAGPGTGGWGQGGSSQVTAVDVLLWVGMGGVGVR